MKGAGVLFLLVVATLSACSYKIDSVMASIKVPLTVKDCSGSDRRDEPTASRKSFPSITAIHR